MEGKIGVLTLYLALLGTAASQHPILELKKSHKDIKLACIHSSKSVQWWHKNETLFEIVYDNGHCRTSSEIPQYMNCDCIAPTFSCALEINKTTIKLLNNTAWKCSTGINGIDRPSNEVMLRIEEPQPPVLFHNITHRGPKLTCYHTSPTVQWWLKNLQLFSIGTYNGTCVSSSALPWYMVCDCLAPSYECVFQINETTVSLLNNTVWKCSVGFYGIDVSSNEIVLPIEGTQTPALSFEKTQHGPKLTCYHTSATVYWCFRKATLLAIDSYNWECVPSSSVPWYMDCDSNAPTHECLFPMIATSQSLLKNTVWKCLVDVYGFDISSNEIKLPIEGYSQTASPEWNIQYLPIIVGTVVSGAIVAIVAAVLWCERKELCSKNRNNSTLRTNNDESSSNSLNTGTDKDESSRSKLSSGTGDVESSCNNLTSGTGDVESTSSNLTSDEDHAKSISNNLTIGTGDDESSSSNLTIGTNNVESSSNSLNSGTDNVESSSNSLNSGTDKVESSSNKLTIGTDNVESRSNSLNSGTDKVESSSKNLISRTDKVESSCNSLTSVTDNIESSSNNLFFGSGGVESSCNNLTSGTDNIELSSNNLTFETDNAESSSNNLTSVTRDVESNSYNLTSGTDNVESSSNNLFFEKGDVK